jgi:hypothetical protein
MVRACSTNGGRTGIYIGYWWEIQKERDHWEDQDVGGWILETDDGMVWIGSTWLRIGTSGGLLRTR